jgi:ubiquinone/menaquinone biosynthesis C-methylase UbiE
MKNKEIQKQRDYYSKTAQCYDLSCAFDINDEHYIAGALLSGLISHYSLRSVLDVGCGTGRCMKYLKDKNPSLIAKGVEPVKELREIALEKGLDDSDICSGDACALDYPDDSFDCVSAFGVLHHIPDPMKAIKEMKRVSRRGIFISDHNIYGMGSCFTKGIKQAFRLVKCRWILKLLMTRGKGYHDTSWDGIFYPFSLVDYLKEITEGYPQSFTFSTKSPGINILNQSSHLAVFSIK